MADGLTSPLSALEGSIGDNWEASGVSGMNVLIEIAIIVIVIFSVDSFLQEKGDSSLGASVSGASNLSENLHQY
jgi:hypothetical protein